MIIAESPLNAGFKLSELKLVEHFNNYTAFKAKSALDLLEYFFIPSDSPMPA